MDLPPDLSGPVTVSDDARPVSFGLEGAAADADVIANGSVATYDDVEPGVDATYAVRSAGVKETLALADGNNELASLNGTTFENSLLGVDRETPSSGSATTYTRQPNGSLVAQRTTSTKQYLLGDRLGSTIALADDGTDSFTRTYAYHAGDQSTTAAVGAGSNATTKIGYAGGYTMPGGRIHFAARYYSPVLVTFINRLTVTATPAGTRLTNSIWVVRTAKQLQLGSRAGRLESPQVSLTQVVLPQLLKRLAGVSEPLRPTTSGESLTSPTRNARLAT